MKPTILLVDDDSGTRFGFSRYLSRAGYELIEASCLEEGREALARQRFDGLLLDLNLPDGKGLDWLPAVRERYPDLAVIMITGAGDIPLAVEAMRRGADHFLTKPVDMASLEVFLRKTLEIGTIRRKQASEQRLSKKPEIFFGRSEAMRKAREIAGLAAENESAVLLQGETGTGKGMLARWIHDHGPRSAQSFVGINCSGLRGELLASELFGNVRGAFTTAVRDRQGLIEVADGGTLFLDEIGDMDLGTQAQFLKVIEEKSFRRLGDAHLRRSDFRLICATNKNLEVEIQKGGFRKDLFYRIQVFPLDVPALREAAEDIPDLIRYLLRAAGHPEMVLPPEVMELLRRYPWPGNIRELHNVLERAPLLARGGPLALEHFPGLHASREVAESPRSALGGGGEEEILGVLSSHGGDVEKAAAALGMSRATFYRRLKKIKERDR